MILGRGGEIIRCPGDEAGNGDVRPLAGIDFVGVVAAQPTVVNVVANYVGVQAWTPRQIDALISREGGAESEKPVDGQREEQKPSQNYGKSEARQNPGPSQADATGCRARNCGHD